MVSPAGGSTPSRRAGRTPTSGPGVLPRWVIRWSG